MSISSLPLAELGADVTHLPINPWEVDTGAPAVNVTSELSVGQVEILHCGLLLTLLATCLTNML